MLKTILKYEVTDLLHDEVIVSMPKDSVILTVELKNDVISLWVEAEFLSTRFANRLLKIRGTGYSFDDTYKYIGTVMPTGGITGQGPNVYEWHFYDGGEI